MQQNFLIVYGALIILFFVVKEAIDMAARIEYAEGAFPWLTRWAEHRKWHRILLLATCLFYGGTLYELLKEPAPPTAAFENPGVSEIAPVVRENKELRQRVAVFTEKESEDSLRRRTIKLASELQDFWAKNPAPAYPGNKDASDYSQKQAAFAEYERKVKRTYEDKYKTRLLEIVRTYKQKEVPTAYLESEAENQIFGAIWFSASGLQPPMCQQDEVCQLRQLAWFVDAKDRPIVSF